MDKKLTIKELSFDISEVDEEQGIIKAVISSGKPDRGGDIIDQSSWILDEYKTNPVILWAHDHSVPAIARALSIGVNEDGMLEAMIQFAINEYDFAKTIFKLYAGRFMRAFSVGFIPGEEEEVNGLRVLKENTLFEFSAVNVGQDALALAKTKGIDTTPIEKINKEEKSPACRKKGERKEDCVERKIPEIIDEGYKRDQAIAMANSMCETPCEEGEKTIEKEGRVLSTKNRAIIEKAKSALDDVLKADKGKKKKKINKVNYKRALNKAIRELLEAKKQ
jgi:hypothetical protein